MGFGKVPLAHVRSYTLSPSRSPIEIAKFTEEIRALAMEALEFIGRVAPLPISSRQTGRV